VRFEIAETQNARNHGATAAKMRRRQEGQKMVDRYTKTMLTIIAVALTCLAAQGAMPRAAARGESCGSSAENACYVTADSIAPLPVEISQ